MFARPSCAGAVTRATIQPSSVGSNSSRRAPGRTRTRTSAAVTRDIISHAAPGRSRGKPSGRKLYVAPSRPLPRCHRRPIRSSRVYRPDDVLNADRHSFKVALAAAGLALTVVSCGSSAKSSSGVASGGPALKEAQCMRSHGVPNFPDPSPGGPSVIPNWINPQAPAFLSAQKACSKFLGGGGSPGAAVVSENVALVNLGSRSCAGRRGWWRSAAAASAWLVPGPEIAVSRVERQSWCRRRCDRFGACSFRRFS